MKENEPIRFSHETLESFCTQVFIHQGFPEDDARIAAEVLITSDLRGIDSHGVARLHPYVDMLRRGKINPKPEITVVRETATTALVDGGGGSGLVIGPHANRIAMEKAEEYGSGWVSVRNSNHYGIAGYYPLQALKRDLIGWSMTNASPIVTPVNGAARKLGTNPIAIAFPGKEEPPIVIDMATSAAAFGKLEIAMRKGEPISNGWAIDAEGNPTLDPCKMRDGGALLPLGSFREQGGHKGYCLATMVDMLTAVLSGANWGPYVVPFVVVMNEPKKTVGKGLGHFFGAMQIEGFMDADEFKGQVDEWIRTIRQTPSAPNTEGVLIPGDPERIAEADRRENGIPLLSAVVENLEEVSQLTGVKLSY